MIKSHDIVSWLIELGPYRAVTRIDSITLKFMVLGYQKRLVKLVNLE